MSTTETGDVQPPQQIELAEQLYRVWRANSLSAPDSDPSSPSYADDWADKPEDIKAQWRALAEVYARLEMHQIEVVVRQRMRAELQSFADEITGLLDSRQNTAEADLSKQNGNPDNRSDLVWVAGMQRQTGKIAAYRDLRTEIKMRAERAIMALFRSHS